MVGDDALKVEFSDKGVEVGVREEKVVIFVFFVFFVWMVDFCLDSGLNGGFDVVESGVIELLL